MATRQKWLYICVVLCLTCGCAKRGIDELTNAMFLQIDARFEEAIDKYSDAITKNNTLLDAHAGLILCYFQLEKGDSVEEDYKTLFVNNSENPIYIYSYGCVQCKKGNVDSALALYQNAATKGLRDGKVYYDIAEIYKMRNDSANAKEFYRKATNTKYGYAFFTLADYTQDEKKKVELMEEGIKYLIDKGYGYYRVGLFHLAKNNEAEANKWFEKADKWSKDKGVNLYKDINLVAPVTYLAEKLFDQMHFEAAIEKCMEAIKYKESCWSAHVTIAWAYYVLGKYDDAMKEFKRTLELYPNHPKALSGIGAIFMQRKQYALSESYFLRRIKVDAFEGHSNLAALYANQGEYEKALKTHDLGLQINPQNAHAYYGKGIIYINLKKYDQAIENLKEAEKIGQEEDRLNSEVYYYIASAYYQRDYRKGALSKETKEICLDYIKHAIDSNPDNKDAQSLYKKISKVKIR